MENLAQLIRLYLAHFFLNQAADLIHISRDDAELDRQGITAEQALDMAHAAARNWRMMIES